MSQKIPKSSGLSTQPKSLIQRPSQPSEEDMYRMDMDELRKRANQQLRDSQ